MPYKDKQKQSEYQNRWMQSRREEWLQENGPCELCGSWDNLEVDHINPDEKVTHNVWSWSAERREQELNKCRVLCSTCHRNKSAKEKASGSQNGRAKLTEQDVKVIRSNRFNKTQSELGREYGVHKNTIGKILGAETWRSI